ncbi:hypothetical protein H4W00_001166 [Psychrobacter sp. PL19]|uniref:hypothetical protein n=1 Tax=Psychrobacter sp. PL19 TaxID=2760711 RepID=UPI001AE50D25
MTSISPTRVSMYDFLYQDTQPMVSLLADAAQLSLPQTQLALGASLQAIVSALLAYQQRYQGQAVRKKLFGRSAVKELRHYNAMNFVTIKATLYHRHDTANALFGDSAQVIKASEHIATQIDATTPQAQTLLTCLCVIVLRELAILTDYSQIDNDEMDKWFALQPQFLSVGRLTTIGPITVTDAVKKDMSIEEKAAPSESIAPEIKDPSLDSERLVSNQLLSAPPPFDPYWYELTTFKPDNHEPNNHEPVQDMQEATADYLKVIGRSSENIQQGRHNDLLIFAQMRAITLPHQRWLLQLAKISDIYLQQNRLRITSEPPTPPTVPLVTLRSIGDNDDNIPIATSETPIEHNAPTPLWKNPIILIIILVIGSLGALATLKYQMKKSNGAIPATEVVLEQDLAEKRQQQDTAVIKEDDTDKN